MSYVLDSSLSVLLCASGNQGLQWFRQSGQVDVMHEGESSTLFDWFETQHAVGVLQQQAHGKSNRGTLGLKASIHLEMIRIS